MTIIRRSAFGGSSPAFLSPSILRSTVVRKVSGTPRVQKSPFERLVQAHCEKIVASGGGRDLVVRLELRFEGACPFTHENTVLRVVEELVANSVEHGFCSQRRGHVFVHVVSDLSRGVQVSVSDDGRGFETGPIIDRNGFHLLRQLGNLYLGAPPGPFVTTAAVTVVIPPLPSQRRAHWM